MKKLIALLTASIICSNKIYGMLPPDHLKVLLPWIIQNQNPNEKSEALANIEVETLSPLPQKKSPPSPAVLRVRQSESPRDEEFLLKIGDYIIHPTITRKLIAELEKLTPQQEDAIALYGVLEDKKEIFKTSMTKTLQQSWLKTAILFNHKTQQQEALINEYGFFTNQSAKDLIKIFISKKGRWPQVQFSINIIDELLKAKKAQRISIHPYST